MEKEQPPSATLDDEVEVVAIVEGNTAPRSQEQESKSTKGGGWWSEEKKVTFMTLVESQMLSRGDRTLNSDEFWSRHVIPTLAQNELTKDCASNTAASLRTRYNTLSSQLTKINRALQVKIKENYGTDGAVYKNLHGEFYSGKGEEEGRAFVAKVYNDDLNENRAKPKPFIPAAYAKETCTSQLF